MSERVRILHVIKDLDLGGTENLLAKHVRQLALDYPDYLSHVVVLGRESSACSDYLAMLPEPPHYLGFEGDYRDPLASMLCIRALRRRILQLRPTIIHSYLWNADVFAQLARLGSGVPQVAHVVDRRVDRNAARLPSRWKTRLTGWLQRRAGSRFVAVSDACRMHVIDNLLLSPALVTTACNGVPIDEFLMPDRRSPIDGAVVAGTISNFQAEKGHRYLIEAMRLVEDAGVPLRLRIAGDGRARQELEVLADTLGVRDQIDFLGRVPSAAEFYEHIDLFVIPSIYAEGLPTTILEAMAAGLPIVTTDVGGAVEAVREGIEGLLVQPRNPKALANAMIALATDADRMRRFGEAGNARVRDKFTIAGMTKAIVDQAYLPLMSGSHRSSETGGLSRSAVQAR